ncbi:DUF998 domain-containing protein [Rhodanobacter denitrificans]|uniref:Putative membrane protein n=1 Tax=Rhodanobacter denitrificans TaxID=666685 RepID=M4NRV0_9GAMM|nr:DUF998 domain-containing protein [Rhodanobacter denitrificans]AGG90271.1 putative membrane protein [Rhodanobacter denitrificans]UJM85656.1 DUF998 domain-containing protein [Rhodanobacter denitrificans]UJM91316.1 DUF998 domain-containing protein [Rhodanobacter denitrificans]
MTDNRLWFGPIAFVLFTAGSFAIGAITPGYSHVRQTVSELGEVGSPGQFAFSVLLCLVAVCLVVYASAAARSLRELGCSAIPAYFLFAMALSCAGVGIFSFPHPLHNVFGISETVGLQAPLVAALVCRNEPRAKQIIVFSIIMYVVVLLAIAINLIPLVRPASLWPLIKPYFGLVQRFLFASWFIWCAGYAVLLMRVSRADYSSKRTHEMPRAA